MRASHYLLPIALLFAYTGCGTEPASGTPEAGAPKADGSPGVPVEDQGEVIAEVGGQKIYAKEFETLASRKTPADGQNLTPEERKEVINKLIEDKALFQEAKKEGVDNDPKVQKVMVNTLLRNKVYANVRNSDFTQDELRAYFDAHKDEFIVPEKIQIKRIFIKFGDERTEAEAKKIADDLRKQVNAAPAKFGDVATEKSEDPYRRRGGDLGFVDKTGKPGVDQAVIDKAFELKQGDISEAFSAGGGYNIVTVANRRERVERTFEQMRGSVLRKVKNEKYKKLYEDYVAQVEKTYTVNIMEDKLNAVKIEPQKHMSLGGPPGLEGMRPGGEDGMEMEGPGGPDDAMPGGMPPGMMPGGPGGLPPGAVRPPGQPVPAPAPAPGG